MFHPFSDFHLPKGLISVIGSGGKTSFLRYMAERADGSVILTTSTHMFPFPEFPFVECKADDLEELRLALRNDRIICTGTLLPSGKLSAPGDDAFFAQLRELTDYVLVEADGSAGLPLKAHREWEPVIPSCSDLTVCMVGASGIGGLPGNVCHCPSLFLALSGGTEDDPVDISGIARVLNKENLADCYFVGQVDVLHDPDEAVRLCEMITKPAFAVSLR